MEIQRGYLARLPFELEASTKELFGTDDLAGLIAKGNMAAVGALNRGKYKPHDAPFYYGKIENLGFIVSHADLYGVE